MSKNIREININQIKIHDPFWSAMQHRMTDTVIPFQEKVLNDEVPGVEKSHAIENFRIAAGLSEGEFYGMVFQDSDVAKWLEGVAYSLAVKPDNELEARADEIIDIIEKAQQPDGYLDTFFIVKEPEHRWQNLQECHELYCAGHMMEAGVAYYQTTGKEKLLHVKIWRGQRAGNTGTSGSGDRTDETIPCNRKRKIQKDGTVFSGRTRKKSGLFL